MDMEYKHISFDYIEQLVPRVPKGRAKSEDDKIQRICVTDTILKALRYMPQTGEFLEVVHALDLKPVLYSYEIPAYKVVEVRKEFIGEKWVNNNVYPVLCNEDTQLYVPDACFSGEKWVLSKIKIKDIQKRKFLIRKFSVQEVFDMFHKKCIWIRGIQIEETNLPDITQQFFKKKKIFADKNVKDFTRLIQKYGIAQILLTLKENL